MLKFLKFFDTNGKTFSFRHDNGTNNKTLLGGLISILSYLIIMSIFSFNLYKFLNQKNKVQSQIVVESKDELFNNTYKHNPDDLVKITLSVEIMQTKMSDHPLHLLFKYFRMSFTWGGENIEILDFQIEEFSTLSRKAYAYLPYWKVIQGINKNMKMNLNLLSCNYYSNFEESFFINNTDKFQNCSTEIDDLYDYKFPKSGLKFEDLNFLINFHFPFYSINPQGHLEKKNISLTENFKFQKEVYGQYKLEYFMFKSRNDSGVFFENITESNYLSYNGIQGPKYSAKDFADGYSFILFDDFSSKKEFLYAPHYLISKTKFFDFLAKFGGILKILSLFKFIYAPYERYSRENEIFEISSSLNNEIYSKNSKNSDDFLNQNNRVKIKVNEIKVSTASITEKNSINKITAPLINSTSNNNSIRFNLWEWIKLRYLKCCCRKSPRVPIDFYSDHLESMSLSSYLQLRKDFEALKEKLNKEDKNISLSKND